MGRSIRVLSLSLVLALAAGKGLAGPLEMTLEINDSQRVGLYGSASNVIVGDPSVADVLMVDGRSVILTGKGFGATHIVVLDAGGHALFDRRVTVIAPQQGHVTLYRGPAAADFSCSPRCQVAAAAAGAASPATPAPPPGPTP